jgi:hypothetical protein
MRLERKLGYLFRVRTRKPFQFFRSKIVRIAFLFEDMFYIFRLAFRVCRRDKYKPAMPVAISTCHYSEIDAVFRFDLGAAFGTSVVARAGPFIGPGSAAACISVRVEKPCHV